MPFTKMRERVYGRIIDICYDNFSRYLQANDIAAAYKEKYKLPWLNSQSIAHIMDILGDKIDVQQDRRRAPKRYRLSEAEHRKIKEQRDAKNQPAGP